MIKSFLRSALRRHPKRSPLTLNEATLPAQQRAYVIGDIHGRADLLAQLLDKVAFDAQSANAHNFLIYLGDYVDRGPQSREVVDLILSTQLKNFTQVHLMGNHEEFLLRFLETPEQSAAWLEYGGKETLLSYGVSIPLGVLSPPKLKTAAHGLANALPAQHLAFYQHLQDCYELGDYFFTHAGIAPNRPLHRQTGEDLRWIREPFLAHVKPYTKIVVHGHTITETPEFHSNRIAIDTGAYHSGRLTCLVLEGEARRILTTAP